jgi:SPP1 family predicted phage head-tail adaptor
MKLSYRLTSRIIIEESKQIFDEAGGYNKTWITKYHSWAHVESLFNRKLVGSEMALAKRVVSSNFYQFTIRYRDNLNQDMRIVFDDKVFTIVKIISDFYRKRFVKIIAEEVVEYTVSTETL